MAGLNTRGIAAQILDLMIDGDMPLDLKVARHCCCKVAGSEIGSGPARDAAVLVEAVEILDTAVLFNVPPGDMLNLQKTARLQLHNLKNES